MFDVNDKPKGLKRIVSAAKNTARALNWLLKNEAAFRQEIVLLAMAIPLSFAFNISISEQIILIIAILFVIFTEILNTAIEAVVDRVGLDIHPLSGLAKDLASAAVGLSLFIAILVWIAVLL